MKRTADRAVTIGGSTLKNLGGTLHNSHWNNLKLLTLTLVSEKKLGSTPKFWGPQPSAPMQNCPLVNNNSEKQMDLTSLDLKSNDLKSRSLQTQFATSPLIKNNIFNENTIVFGEPLAFNLRVKAQPNDMQSSNRQQTPTDEQTTTDNKHSLLIQKIFHIHWNRN